MDTNIALAIEVEQENGLLNIIFNNNSSGEVSIRAVYLPTEVIIENGFRERAEYYLSFPFGAKVSTIDLPPMGSYKYQVNLASDFIYPRSGVYTVWIKYDSRMKTALYAPLPRDVFTCESNRVQFEVTM